MRRWPSRPPTHAPEVRVVHGYAGRGDRLRRDGAGGLADALQVSIGPQEPLPGRVGTGFDGKILQTVYGRLKKLETVRSPLREVPPGQTVRDVHWVKPTLVAEVAFTEWTQDGTLRHRALTGSAGS